MTEICKQELKNQTFTLPGFRKFRTGNDIFQKEIAEYLGTSVAFISAVERCQAKLPGDKLVMLLENPFGWNTEELFSAQGQKNVNAPNFMSGAHAVGGGNDIGSINNYGVSEEEVEKRVDLATAILRKDLEIAQARNDQMSRQILFLEEEIRGLRELLGKKIAAK